MKRLHCARKGILHLFCQCQRPLGRILAGQWRVEQHQQAVTQKPLQRAAGLLNQRARGLMEGVERGDHLLGGNRTGIGGKAAQVGKQNRHGAALAVQQRAAAARIDDHRCHWLRQETAQPVGPFQLRDLLRHLALQLAVPGLQFFLLRIDFLIQRAQLPAHAVDVPCQPAEFILVGNCGPGGEVSGGDGTESAADLLHRPQHRGGNCIARQQRQQHRGHARPDNQGAGTHIGAGRFLRTQVHPGLYVLCDCIGVALNAQCNRGKLLLDQFGNPRGAAGLPRLCERRCDRRQALYSPLQSRKPGIPRQILPFHLPDITGDNDRQVIGFIQGLCHGQTHAARRL
ncbi:hypothetical protein A9D60_22110 [Leisingera sp. JC1]|nr:hypothetical protein [Leisingera sp. JC1]OBY25489.1 hypothetical protein A9D60_22110 [Leisingera sp. JC1]